LVATTGEVGDLLVDCCGEVALEGADEPGLPLLFPLLLLLALLLVLVVSLFEPMPTRLRKDIVGAVLGLLRFDCLVRWMLMMLLGFSVDRLAWKRARLGVSYHTANTDL
jgi:hypothetical protein